ncbi:MAG: B12-binding domain-containing radical SAM protein [Gammaproteobacteria bacterium]|nr:B12-binding domain-containing radical SAM protein [Gammaproteobacteria bacterium]
MKIAIIIPGRPYLFVQKSFPFLGPMMVSSALKSYGHEVKILDFADGYTYTKADFYGIFATSSDWDEVMRVKEYILDHDQHARIMVGGPHATYNQDQCGENFDYVAVGDGTESAVDIINHSSGEQMPYISTGLTRDIDRYHPDKDALNLWDYEFYIDGKRATSMITALSCPYGKCAFCSRPPGVFNHPQYHSAGWCIEEIMQIEALGFKALMLYDDEFFTWPTRDEKIIEYLKQSKIEAWRCFVRSDYSLKHPGLVIQASESGLKEVLIGIESGSNTILNAVRKGTTSEQNTKALEMFSDLDINVKCAMIMGLPSESPETLRETWVWCENNEQYVAAWDFTTYVPLPGSAVYDDPELFDFKFDKKNSLVPYKAMNMDSEVCEISTSTLSFDEIQEAREIFERRFKHGEMIEDILYTGDLQ